MVEYTKMQPLRNNLHFTINRNSYHSYVKFAIFTTTIPQLIKPPDTCKLSHNFLLQNKCNVRYLFLVAFFCIDWFLYLCNVTLTNNASS